MSLKVFKTNAARTAYRECHFVVINQIRRSDKPRRTVIVTTAEHFAGKAGNLYLSFFIITFDFLYFCNI